MTVTRSAAGLLARASSRERVTPADARSGAVFERIVVGSDGYFVKHLGFASDWVMRVTGDDVCRQYLIWQAGIMDRFPDCIDHAVVAMDLAGAGEGAVLTIVMREVGGFLVPPGDAVVPAGQHAGFMSHMAALSSAFWGWEDHIGLTTMAQRMRFFAPDTIAAELAADQVPAAIAAAAAGWRALPGRSPLLARLARLVHDRPEVLVPGAQPGPAARIERSSDQPVPGRARTPRDRHRQLVAAATRPVHDRHHGRVRLGEGARRPRRAVLVGGTDRRRRHPPAHPDSGIMTGPDVPGEAGRQSSVARARQAKGKERPWLPRRLIRQQ